MRQEKHEPSGEKEEEDEDASYYPEDNFLLFSHPGLSLRKEYTYPVSIMIQFWISGTTKMAMEETRYRLPRGAFADKGLVWRRRHQPFGGRDGQAPYLKHDEDGQQGQRVIFLKRF